MIGNAAVYMLGIFALLLIFLIVFVRIIMVMGKSANKKSFDENKSLQNPAVEVTFGESHSNGLGKEIGKIYINNNFFSPTIAISGMVVIIALLASLFIVETIREVAFMMLIFYVVICIMRYSNLKRSLTVYENGVVIQEKRDKKTLLFSDMISITPTLVDDAQAYKNNSAPGVGLLPTAASNATLSYIGGENGLYLCSLLYNIKLRNGEVVSFNCRDMTNAEYMAQYLNVWENPAIVSYSPVKLIPDISDEFAVTN